MTDDEQAGFGETIELVRQAKSGDGAALNAILERYHQRVLAVVRGRLGPELRRHADSMDLVQETLCEAVRDFDRFDMRDENALIKWLAALCENRMRDMAKFYRAEKRRADRAVPLAGSRDSSPDFDPARSTLSPADKASRAEMGRRVQTAMRGLKSSHREVLERRSADEKWGAIANAMELASEDAARMLHARAKVALLKAVSENDV